MDSLITAAGRALAAGDPLGALKRIALRDDPPALALRGIAMAQLGDLVRAKALLRAAARAFGPKEALARARCIVAEAEIALASRDLDWDEKALTSARTILDAHGDRVNAAHARYVEIRRLVLIGRIEDAEARITSLDPALLPPALRTAHELVVAGIEMRRRLRTHPGSHHGGRTRAPRLEHSRRAFERQWRGTPPVARRSRSATGIESIGRRRLSLRRARRTQRGLACKAPGTVHARTHAR